MPRWTCNSETTFVMKENLRSFSGDSFTVKDAEDNVVFEVDGTKLSISEKKTLKDAEGCPLYQIWEPPVSLRETQKIGEPDGDVVMTLRKKGFVGSYTVLAWAGDDDDGEESLIIKGGIREKNFDVKTPDGETVAEISRDRLNALNIVSYVFNAENRALFTPFLFCLSGVC